MTMEAGLGTGTSELCSPGCQAQDLLVLTQGQSYGHDGLSLPFQNATVLGVGSLVDAETEGHFDTIVLDGNSSDLIGVDAAARRALPALRQGGRILIPLNPTAAEDLRLTIQEPPTFQSLTWRGLGLLNGRPCAVLIGGESDGTQIAALLINAHDVLRLASVEGKGSFIALDSLRNELAQHRADRSRSEQALLGHLSLTARELDRARERQQELLTWRAFLRRSKLGRRLLPILRPIWHRVRRIRRRIRGFYSRTEIRKN